MKHQIYIIEHLEPKLWQWCIFEYEHVSNLIGKNNLWITNIKNSKEKNKLKKLKIGIIFKESIKDIISKLENPCILDPESSKTLNPRDSTNFNYFIFGGILGDYPPRKRTKKELTNLLKKKNKEIQVRSLGKKQMSTDNAVFTVFQIAKKHKNLRKFKFKDKISIKINEFESIELPYRYNLINDKPFISSKVIDYLKKKKSF